jgi:membrane protein
VAFNVLLAGVPFLLLLSSVLGYVLGGSPDAAADLARVVIQRLLPAGTTASNEMLAAAVGDVVRTRAIAGIGGLVGFLWFSSYLFGSLRSVMAVVFRHGKERSFFVGKLWDFQLTLSSVVLLTAWAAVSTWLIVTSGRFGHALAARGLLADVTTGIEYVVTRALSVVVVVMIFFSLYRWLPRTRTPTRIAFFGALAATALFEVAKWVFGVIVGDLAFSSVYTGTFGALIIIVFWSYYSALMFVLGAEFAVTVKEFEAEEKEQAKKEMQRPDI